MSAITPRGESLRRAVRCVSDALHDDPDAALGPLVQEASLRFDLTPAETEYLTRFYREAALARGRTERDSDAAEAGNGPPQKGKGQPE